MSQPINRYKADLRELNFVLFEQFHAGEFLGKGPYTEWGEEEVRLTINEAYRFVTEVTGPLNGIGDKGCKLENGQVITPAGFKEAWTKLYEMGFKGLSVDAEFGGQGAPKAVAAIVSEMLSGSNSAFDMYPSLTVGAAEFIESFGTHEEKEFYCTRMFSGQWGGTMCLTEAQAGSDVGLSTTTATKEASGNGYKIKGTKIFISGGDQDFTDNIIHMVLARIPGAPKGTKGLSLFIVPKNRSDKDGKVTGPNDVKVGSIEHKMGINGSSTCVLNFGEEDGCIGYLLGGENQGIRQMFQMMNYARIGVGLQGLAVASTAYLNALEYSRERKQGASIAEWKDPGATRITINQHPDVRRMLLDMKARVEGIRALIVKGATHFDRMLLRGGKDDEANIHDMGQIELLTPLVKAYSSDQAFRVCETAIQVLGGVGYTKDFPVEQYARDAKIFSIYEGTNHIQALDLVARKLGQRGGANMQAFLGDVQQFIDKNRNHEVVGSVMSKLAQAHEAVASTAMQFLAWFQSGQMVNVPLAANRFLSMMSELTVGWLLMEAAVIATEAQKKLDKGHPDWAFYEGKKHTARYWANSVLPHVVADAEVIRNADASPMDIPDAAFATV